MNKAIASQHIEPEFWQELHSPTEVVEGVVRREWDDKAGRYRTITREVHRRRKRDAAIWGAFTPQQEAAAEDIGHGRNALAGQLGMKAASMQARVDGMRKAASTDRNARLITQYFDWAMECQRQGMSVAIPVAVICEGMNLKQCQQTYRKRHEAIRSALFDGVDLYAKMFP